MADLTTDLAPDAAGSTGAPGAIASVPRTRNRFSLLTRRDKITLGLMVGLPLIFDLALIWGPTVTSVLFSFTKWNGIGAITGEQVIGFKNYESLFNSYPFFWPALAHNFMWLGFLMFIATPIGIFFAVLLDRELKASRFYQTVFYLPVVLSLAVIGIIWTLQYAPEQGFINNALGRTSDNNLIDWLGNPSLNLWAALVAASWRHVGYIMILYLAGLKALDPTLREAASIDGASEVQTFRHVVFPALKPINIIVLVVTVIESLRAFDIVYVTNKGSNGLELLSVLVYNNIVGEASRIGFGSALAVILLVISLGVIVPYLAQVFRKDMA